MRNCCYGRVSKEEQSRNSNAATQQKARLAKVNPQKVFFDVQSGSDDSRPDFEQMMEEIKNRKWDRVTITRDDRITRRGTTALTILELFLVTDTELEILDGGGVIDLTNPYEWKQRALAGVDSEYFLKILKLSIKRGYEHLREEKKANPQVPFGYIRVKERYEIDPRTEAIAHFMIKTFIEIKTIGGTCKLLLEKHEQNWTPSGLKRWLLNPVLRGHTPYFHTSSSYRNIAYSTHLEQALISNEQDKNINMILKENSSYRGVNISRPRYPASGLCVCGECGSKMSCCTGRKGIKFYYCRKRHQNKALCSQKLCVRIEAVEDAIVSKLVEKSQDIVSISRVVEHEELPEIKALKSQLQGLRQLGDNPAIQVAIAQIKDQIQQVQCQSLNQCIEEDFRTKVLTDWATAFLDSRMWLTQDMDVRRSLYLELVSRVVIHEGKVQRVELNF